MLAEPAEIDPANIGRIGEPWPKSLGPAHDLTLMLAGYWRGTHGIDACGWGFCDRGDGSVLAIEGKAAGGRAFPGRWKEIKLRARDLGIVVHRKREGDSAEASTAGGLSIINPADWAAELTPPREWVLTDWIPARQATYLTGAGSAGKSLLSQLLCTCIALGVPFLGIPTRAAKTIYVTCEDDADELHRRQKAINAGLVEPLSRLAGRLHLVSLAGAVANELATFTAEGKLKPTKSWKALRSTVLEIGPELIVLDNVAHLFAGNENIRNQVAAFVGLLNSLAQEAGAAILFLGHPNKAGAAFSGSTAWENQVRSRLFLETPTLEDGAVPDPDARVLSRGKANYARNGERIDLRWHDGTFMRPIDIIPDALQSATEATQATFDNQVFLTCLAERNRQQRTVSENKASRTYAPKEFAAMPEAKGVSRSRLETAMERLFRSGAIERGFIWRDAAEGKDRYGLRASADLSADVPPTSPLTSPPSSADVPPTTAHTHPIPLGIEGAAPEGTAAPPLGSNGSAPTSKEKSND